MRCLSRRLGVAPSVTLAETVAYAANCKLGRGEQVEPTAVLDLWDALDDSLKQRSKHDQSARLLILGANPRKPDALTQATAELPHTTKFLANYILSRSPRMLFNVIALRLNSNKGPHRDANNGPEDSFMQVITKTVSGGNLWIADASGDTFMSFQGMQVPGRVHPCHEAPITFSGKTKLHATEPWTGPRRLVLLAWSTNHLDPLTSRHLKDELNFPVSTRSETQSGAQLTLKAALELSALSKPHQHPQWDNPVISVPSSSSENHDSLTLCPTTPDDPPISRTQAQQPESPSSFASTIRDEKGKLANDASLAAMVPCTSSSLIPKPLRGPN